MTVTRQIKLVKNSDHGHPSYSLSSDCARVGLHSQSEEDQLSNSPVHSIETPDRLIETPG